MSGLYNHGSNCYINSILQALFAIEDFTKILKNTVLRKDNENTKLVESWKSLNDEIMVSLDTVDPRDFISSVRSNAKYRKNDTFSKPGQNDATEFLVFLIEGFHAAISGPSMMIKSRPSGLVDKKVWELIKNNYSDNYSELMDMFYGINVTEIVSLSASGHHHKNIKAEQFFITNLVIPNDKIESDIYDCLDYKFSQESLCGSNQWYNDKKKRKEDAILINNIYSFPDIMTFTISRYTKRERDMVVGFPLDNLYMRRYAINNKKEITYELFAVCNHFGHSLDSGHYNIFVKENNKWICYDDQDFYSIRTCDVVTNNAYCLFYRGVS